MWDILPPTPGIRNNANFVITGATSNDKVGITITPGFSLVQHTTNMSSCNIHDSLLTLIDNGSTYCTHISNIQRWMGASVIVDSWCCTFFFNFTIIHIAQWAFDMLSALFHWLCMGQLDRFSIFMNHPILQQISFALHWVVGQYRSERPLDFNGSHICNE